MFDGNTDFWGQSLLATKLIENKTEDKLEEIKAILEADPTAICQRSGVMKTDPFYLAMALRYPVEFLDFLVEKGANVWALDGQNFGRTALFGAALRANLSYLEFYERQPGFLEHVHDVDNRNQNLLHYVVFLSGIPVSIEDRKKTVDWLLKKGVDLHVRNVFDRTPAQEAKAQGLVELSEYMNSLDNEPLPPIGEDPKWFMIEDFNYRLPILRYSYNGEMEAAKTFLAEDTSTINIKGGEGRETPLLTASYYRAPGVDYLKLLLDNGADIQSTGLNSTNVLHSAANIGHVEYLEFLLNQPNCPDINATTDNGITPLLAACMTTFSFPLPSENERIEAIKVLLKNGADLNTEEKFGIKASELADKAGFKEVAKFLSALELENQIVLVSRSNTYLPSHSRVVAAATTAAILDDIEANLDAAISCSTLKY